MRFRNPVILERMRFPDPVISVSVQPKVKGDQEKFGARPRQDGACRSSLHLETARETPDDMSGMGELHLEGRSIACERNSVSKAPWASRRWLIAKHHAQDPRAVRPQETDGRLRHSPKCGSLLSRSNASKGFEFVDDTSGVSVPREYVPSVEKGLKLQKEMRAGATSRP